MSPTITDNAIDRDDADIVFTATTENATGRANRLTARILIGALTLFFACGGLFIAFRPPRPGDDLWVRYTFTVICFLIGPLLFALLRFAPRGTWHIDAKGVKSTSINGDEEFLAWDEIDAVNWHSLVVGFRSRSQKLTPHLQYMNVSDRKALLAFIEHRLKGEFDLRFLPTTKITAKRWLLIFAVAISITAAIVGWLLAFALFLQPMFDQWGVPREVGVVVVFLPFLIPVGMMHRWNRKFPIWRERHKRYPIFDEPAV